MIKRVRGMFVGVLLALSTPAQADGPIFSYAFPQPLALSSPLLNGVVPGTPKRAGVWAIDRSDTWQVLREDARLSAGLQQWEDSRRWQLAMSSTSIPLPGPADASNPILLDSGRLRIAATMPLPQLGGAVVDSVLAGPIPSGPPAVILRGTTIGQAAGDLLAAGATPLDPVPVIPRAVLHHAQSYTLRFRTRADDTIELTASFLLSGESRAVALERARSSNTVESVHVIPGGRQAFFGTLREVPAPMSAPAGWFHFDLPEGRQDPG